MPIIFQGQCSLCGYKSPTISDVGYGAVIVDDQSTVPKYAEFPGDSRIAVLGHPLEQHIIEEIGYSYTSATIQGRYLRFHEYFCKACGHVYETRQLTAASFSLGCLPPVVFAFSCGILIGIYRSSILDALVGFLIGGFVAWVIIDWGVGSYVRLRFPARAREFRIGRQCPKCGSTKATQSGTLTCPSCHKHSMKIKAVGMS